MSNRPFNAAELDGVDPRESTDLLRMARELERLDGGPIRPSDGFTDRVLSAIAGEPLPRPMAVAGVAAREGRLGAMVGALRDTWHVAWSGGRPVAARAQAMAFVLLLVLVVGSVGAATTVGAINVLFSTSSTPSVQPAPSDPAVVSPSPEPTETPSPSPAPVAAPSTSPDPTKTAKPAPTPTRTDQPAHTETPEPNETDESKETDDPDEDHGGSGSGRGGGGETDHP
jgi:hypothetical protein